MERSYLEALSIKLPPTINQIELSKLQKHVCAEADSSPGAAISQRLAQSRAVPHREGGMFAWVPGNCQARRRKTLVAAYGGWFGRRLRLHDLHLRSIPALIAGPGG